MFGDTCQHCPLRERCTTAEGGGARSPSPATRPACNKPKADQRAPEWQAAYRATRPKVERKIGHLTRRAWGGRLARTRGVARVLTDVVTRAAAINLARLATLGLHHDTTSWAAPAMQ